MTTAKVGGRARVMFSELESELKSCSVNWSQG